MKVCLIAVEIFAWGKYGGFGRATRIIGRELAKRGVEVCAVVPRRKGQEPVENLDGIRVLSYSPLTPWAAAHLFQKCNADIYHSCEPSYATHLAMRTMPDRKHIVTVRDPRTFDDWKIEYRRPSLSKMQVLANFAYENSFIVRRAVRRVDAVFTTANSLIPKVNEMYGLASAVRFLPTPVDIKSSVRKAESPTVCYMGRLDRRKRPELFCELAKKFSSVRFAMVGRSRDVRWEKKLRETYAGTSNLEMLGFINQFSSNEHSKILENSWVMINTAAREGLPNAFLEAAAHKCAVLSAVDTDGFASRFGCHVADGNFEQGLSFLLSGSRWHDLGARGYGYVQDVFATDRAIDRHLDVYDEVLKGAKPRGYHKHTPVRSW